MKYTSVDHTFAICAYKESPYLEECILSLLKQTVRSEIIICTSTPNAHIASLAEKYNLPILLNSVRQGVSIDFNFALKCCRSRLVTLAHQDNVYKETYTEQILKEANSVGDNTIILIYTEQAELRNGLEESRSSVSIIKHIMNAPLRIKAFQNSRFIRRKILSLGCPISCSAVTFYKDESLIDPFSNDYKHSPDWHLWGRLALKKGLFIYLPERLVLQRIHGDSNTTVGIKDNSRYLEELSIFQKYWPEPIAKGILHFYSKAYKSNKV